MRFGGVLGGSAVQPGKTLEGFALKVSISGYYGFGNLGDEALLSGILSGLTEENVTVLSQRPTETSALHGVASTHRITGLTKLLTCDVLVSGGGGLLQDKTSTRSLQYYLGVITLAKRLGKRVIVYGQSVGPLSAAGERAVAKTLQALPVAVRDKPSQTLLARLGVPAALVADAALLLPKPAAVPSENAPALFIPRGGLPETTHAFIQLARTLHAEGIPLAGLALQADKDGEALEQLLEAVPEIKKVSVTTPREALEAVAQSRYVVSARLHGLVFAAHAGRPLSGVAYDPKVKAFLDELGCPAHPVAPDPEALLHEFHHPRFGVARVAALRARARDGLTWLQGELARPSQAAPPKLNDR